VGSAYTYSSPQIEEWTTSRYTDLYGDKGFAKDSEELVKKKYNELVSIGKSKDKRVYDQNGNWTGYIVSQVWDAQFFLNLGINISMGFDAVGLVKYVGGKVFDAILVFRGSNDIFDWLHNVDKRGVGYGQYANTTIHKSVMDWVKAQGTVSLVGHSLGGALAQWFAVDISKEAGVDLKRVETFNAPGISKEHADKFNKKDTKVIHHIVSGDFVSLAGEAFIATDDVRIYTVKVGEFWTRHSALINDLKPTTPYPRITDTTELNSRNFTYKDKDFIAQSKTITTAVGAITGAAGGGGWYTVCIELFVDGEYTVLERTFAVTEFSHDMRRSPI